jgi:hypothetical protein
MTPLIVMRLADMKRVHPLQITAQCSKCGETVGVYPSGQAIMRDYPGEIELVCQVCKPSGGIQVPVPGALLEPFQSRDKTTKS